MSRTRAREIALVARCVARAVEIARRRAPRSRSRHRSTMLAPLPAAALPGQALAHHQRDRVLERRVGAVGDLVVLAAAMVAVLEHRGEVGRHARHAARADRLDARLLDRVEDRARGLPSGASWRCSRVVVAGEPQRHANRRAPRMIADFRRSGKLARRLGQADLVAVEGRAGPDAKVDLELGLRARNGAHAAGDATRLNGSAGASFVSRGLRVRDWPSRSSSRRSSAPRWRRLSGSSSPKQRW